MIPGLFNNLMVLETTLSPPPPTPALSTCSSHLMTLDGFLAPTTKSTSHLEGEEPGEVKAVYILFWEVAPIF